MLQWLHEAIQHKARRGREHRHYSRPHSHLAGLAFFRVAQSVFAALIVFGFPFVTNAAIARDGGVTYADLSAGSQSTSFTVNTSGDGLVVQTFSGSTADPVCTYNSVTMNDLGSNGGDGVNVYVLWNFYLPNQSAGTHTVSCTISSGSIGIAAFAYSGVDTSDVPTLHTTMCAIGTHSCTITNTSPATTAWAVVGSTNDIDPTGGTNLSLTWGTTHHSGQIVGGDSNGTTGTTGSYSQTINWDGAFSRSGFYMSQFFLKEASSPPPTTSPTTISWGMWW